MATNSHQPYITLDSIIDDYMTEAELSNHKYFKLFHLAFRCFEQLGLDFFYRIKSVKLPVNSNFTVTLPPDYLNWTKVGVLSDGGEIIPLYYNDKLTTFADLASNRLEQTQDPQSTWVEWNSNTWCNWWNGWGYANIYGVPSGEPFMGSFKIDTENGVLLLNERFNRDYVMLEYVSSPREGQTYYLPLHFREAVISWLRWMDAISSIGRSHMKNASIETLERMYWRDRRNAIARWKPSRIYDKYQTSQEMSRLAIKT